MRMATARVTALNQAESIPKAPDTSMVLNFVPAKLPRSMTRQEWREAYRWLRIVSKTIEWQVANQLALRSIFGTGHL